MLTTDKDDGGGMKVRQSPGSVRRSAFRSQARTGFHVKSRAVWPLPQLGGTMDGKTDGKSKSIFEDNMKGTTMLLLAATFFSPGWAKAGAPVQVMASAVTASNQARILTVNQGGNAVARAAGGGMRQVIVSQSATPPYVWQQLDPESQKIKDQFLAATVVQRKSLAEKKAALRTMQNSVKGDAVAASRLAGEIFELREQLRIEARKTGLPDNVLFSMPVDPGYTGNVEGE